MRIGVIGGTGMANALDDPTGRTVQTPHGDVDVAFGVLGGRDVVFLARHGAGSPAHKVPHAAHMDAMRRCDVDAVLAVQNVGALRGELRAGDLVVPDDLFGLFAPDTLFDDEIVHVSMDPPYCPRLRSALRTGLDDHTDGGTYVQVRGPRLEAPAESRFLAGLGDVVGMTGAAEATIARESGLCYAALCFVANAAPGLGEPANAQEIRDALAARSSDLAQAIARAVAAVPAERDCMCRGAPEAGRL